MNLDRAEDYYLKIVANFESSSNANDGAFVKHAWGKLLVLYSEQVGATKDSMTGERFSGVPIYQTMQSSDGQPVSFPEGYDLDLRTYKEIWGTQSRTVGNYAAQMALMPENFVYLNAKTAREMGLQDGTPVRLESPDFGGSFEVGSGEPVVVRGRVKTVEGLRPGAVAISFHYGHWAYGARDVTIDDQLIPGEPARGKGLVPNPAMSVDRHLKDVTLTDLIAGDSAFGGTKVRLVKIGEADTAAMPTAGSYSLGPTAALPGPLSARDGDWLQAQALRAARGDLDPDVLRARMERLWGKPLDRRTEARQAARKA